MFTMGCIVNTFNLKVFLEELETERDYFASLGLLTLSKGKTLILFILLGLSC